MKKPCPLGCKHLHSNGSAFFCNHFQRNKEETGILVACKKKGNEQDIENDSLPKKSKTQADALVLMEKHVHRSQSKSNTEEGRTHSIIARTQQDSYSSTHRNRWRQNTRPGQGTCKPTRSYVLLHPNQRRRRGTRPSPEETDHERLEMLLERAVSRREQNERAKEKEANVPKERRFLQSNCPRQSVQLPERGMLQIFESRTIGKTARSHEGIKRQLASMTGRWYLPSTSPILWRAKAHIDQAQFWRGTWRHFPPPTAADKPPLHLQAKFPIMLHIPYPPKNPITVAQSMVSPPHGVAPLDH